MFCEKVKKVLNKCIMRKKINSFYKVKNTFEESNVNLNGLNQIKYYNHWFNLKNMTVQYET